MLSTLSDLHADDRAIEGLPIRLVIAFIVGVAALGIMLNTLNSLGGLAVRELDARPHPEVVGTGPQELTITAVDASGSPVEGATVVLRGDTARLDAVQTGTTGADGNVTFTVDPSLAANQADGTLDITVKPPAGSDYADRRGNTDVLVLSDASPSRRTPLRPR